MNTYCNSIIRKSALALEVQINQLEQQLNELKAMVQAHKSASRAAVAA